MLKKESLGDKREGGGVTGGIMTLTSTGDADMDAKFIKEATETGFVNLKGHRSVGGMRASIYNAMPVEGVEKLVAFMEAFEQANS